MAALTLPGTVPGTLPLPGFRPGSLPSLRPRAARPGRRPARPTPLGVEAPALPFPPAEAAVAPVTGSAVLPSAVYLRRRLAALALLLVLAVGAQLALSAAWSTVTTPPGQPATATVAVPVPASATAVVTVAPGDTLWSIASSLRPGADPRPLVDELARRNGGSATVQAGQQLDVSGL